MVEWNGLENRHASQGASRVQIPPSPPANLKFNKNGRGVEAAIIAVFKHKAEGKEACFTSPVKRS